MRSPSKTLTEWQHLVQNEVVLDMVHALGGTYKFERARTAKFDGWTLTVEEDVANNALTFRAIAPPVFLGVYDSATGHSIACTKTVELENGVTVDYGVDSCGLIAKITSKTGTMTLLRPWVDMAQSEQDRWDNLFGVPFLVRKIRNNAP